MLKKIIKFIKYSNVFTLIAIAAFVAVASVMAANDDVKKIIGEEIVKKSGVDNTVLLSTDLDNFDLAMEITNALEDDQKFYIGYQYNTLAIKDNVWREVLKQEQITVSKATLAGGDLGLYAMEELGEIINYQISYLKKVQQNEKEKGQTFVQETAKYTGLIGLVLDTKTKELPGYGPVVKPPVVEETTPTPSRNEFGTGSLQGGDDWDLDENQENYDDFTGAPEDNNCPDGAPVWEQLEKNCLDSDRFWDWDSKTCNNEEEVKDKEETTPASPSKEEDPEDLEAKEDLTEEPVADEEPTEPVADPVVDETEEDPEEEIRKL